MSNYTDSPIIKLDKVDKETTKFWLNSVSNYTKPSGIKHWYLQYCLVTGLYMIESWERKLFNSVVLTLTIIIFTIFYFVSSVIF